MKIINKTEKIVLVNYNLNTYFSGHMTLNTQLRIKEIMGDNPAATGTTIVDKQQGIF